MARIVRGIGSWSYISKSYGDGGAIAETMDRAVRQRWMACDTGAMTASYCLRCFKGNSGLYGATYVTRRNMGAYHMSGRK